ncbi:efflux transporter, RND family, MFP subunit [Nautilia profundicola AmH]|uniref:Efflux transporter, RND family, MFP subunit n=1 Tax=Nautilia profundicola (strain ATCC BAA-1463 / DSM 18972 / AmH) TaxID=598659 RepID=B9L846_NAUPA|nr:efflux RND transporter periplasmic adaptor subunit [Nautilia profundicola]ACM92772.1 efflux transporter, RND family, MFP subunit [Nautilia profundicola AmH]
MKILKIVIPVLLAVILAVSGMRLIKKRQAVDEKLPPAEQIAIVVKTITPKIENKTITLPYVATVKNDNEVLVNTKFAGKILYIKNLGDDVKKGEVVAKIDSSDLNAKLKEINSQIASVKNKLSAEEINLKNLLATHARTKQLLDVKMASIEQYQTEESKIATLKAQIKADKNSLNALYANKQAVLNNLTYTTLKSPINGVISAKMLNKDDIAFMGKPILKITPKNGNYLFITLPKDYKQIVYKGKVYDLKALNNTFNSLKTFKAEVNDPTLLNGEKVNIKVVEFSGKGMFLPYDAILTVNGKNYVFVVNGNKTDIKEVKILAQGEKYALIDQNITSPVVYAKPDILLRIKAGYPIKVEN